MLVSKLALIGVGGYGRSHLETIHELERSGEVKLIAVADPFVENQPQLHDQLAAQGIRWYREYREMFARERDLDAVVISTPIHCHERMVEDALAQTDARILLEKPPVPTIQQLDRIIAADASRRVRVGFQMIHWPCIQSIKSLLASGEAGAVNRIVISAGWPRTTEYYQRASWAGRLSFHGEPVFDGPATNALAHLIHAALYFAGSGSERFAAPRQVSAGLYRSRRIESYDAAWIQADLGHIELHVALAHCVKDLTPFHLRIETDRGSLSFRQERLAVENTLGLHTAIPHPAGLDKQAAYRSFLSPHPAPTTLIDVRPYTLLTNAALAASGGVQQIPDDAVVRDSETEDVIGLTSYLREFCKNPQSPAEAGFPWAPLRPSLSVESLSELDWQLLGMPGT